MSKQIIDHGFDVIETREIFYTEEAISKLNQQIVELQKQLAEKDKTIQGLIESQKYLEKSASYQIFLDIQKQLEETKTDLFLSRNEIDTLKGNLAILNEHKKVIEEQYLEKCKELKSQPAEIVEKIRKEFQKHLIDWYEDEENINKELYIDADWVWEVLDTVLKEYQN